MAQGLVAQRPVAERPVARGLCGSRACGSRAQWLKGLWLKLTECLKATKDKQRPLLITKQRNEETINWLKILEICVAPSIPSPAVLSQLLASRRWGLKIVVVAAWPASVSCGTALATAAPGAGQMQLGKIIFTNAAKIGHEDQEKYV